MRTFLDVTCGRCGFRSSALDVGVEFAAEFAASHVCADGVRPDPDRSSVSTRVVPGPGERLSDVEPSWPR